MWSTGKVLENANIFFIYIAHANTYLVVCMKYKQQMSSNESNVEALIILWINLPFKVIMENTIKLLEYKT